MKPIDLYLDLLKKSLTGTLFAAEPDVDQDNEARFVYEFNRHYIRGQAVSMMPVVRLDNLQSCLIDVLQKGVPGDVIETGVWRGGGTIFMRAVFAALDVTDRVVWFAYSFVVLPEPDPELYPIEAKAHAGVVMKYKFSHFAASL